MAMRWSAWVSISVGCNNTCTFCIVPSLRGERLAVEARSLLAAHPAPAPMAPPEHWLAESWHEAREHGYPRETESPVMISHEFHERSKAIAERRLVAAGYRLAERLNRAFGR